MLIREKVRQAKKILGELGIDCWMTFVRESGINGDPSLAFLAAADVTWHSAFIITSSGEAHAIVGRYDRKTVEETGAYDSVTAFDEGIRASLLERMRAIDPAQIAINYSKESEIADGLTYGMYLTLHDMLEEIGLQDRLVSAEGIVSALRERKTETELEYIRGAVRITEEIFGEVAGFIRPGRSEEEIATFMTEATKRRELEPAWDGSTCPAVFTGPDTAQAHYAPSDRTVEPGHVLNMDFGVKVNGYCSDLQRTFYVLAAGETGPPEDVAKGFRTIVDSIEAAREAIRPGVEGREIDAIARTRIVEAGYEEFPHALGHQVGRFAHDGTALLGPAWEKYAGKPYRKLEPGMVFTIEPRLTVPDRGVVTIEEMIVVTPDGAEYLSTPQRELLVVES